MKMMRRSTFPLAALAAVAKAAQPGAVEAVAAPMRDLTWGKINFLHTTDTHGWLAGHLTEPQYSADWGDYVSFAHHMHKQADDKGVDLLLVDTGDRVEGNGLYDASTPKGFFQYDIFAEQKIDILCTGNHELYQPYSADREHNTTLPNFKDAYVASNLDYIDPDTGDQVPQAPRYRKFKTKNQGLEVLALGFIFNFDGNADNTVVTRVEETIKQEWFLDAIRQRPDLFVVIGHVGLRMDEFKTIFTAIRREDWDTPIAFFGGHAHVRDARSYDSKSFAIASGRYLETIGWMSIDGIKAKSSDEISTQVSTKFTRRYIDNNLYGMHYHTGLNESTFPTKRGKAVSNMISGARKAMSLDSKLGCAPSNYYMSRAKYPSNESIYSWIEEEVFPDIIVNDKRKDKSRLAIMNSGGIRFDIFEGQFTRDSAYTVSPFVSGFKYVPDVPYKIAKRVIGILNSGSKILGSHGVESRFMTIPEQRYPIDIVPNEEEERKSLELRDNQLRLNSDPDLIYGYTTKDDIGSDGDDTVHEPLNFYGIPNCVQSEIAFPEGGDDPDEVDLVFIDFIQPWIIPALKFSGGDYNDDDVKDYMEGTFTYKMSQWIMKNWDGDC